MNSTTPNVGFVYPTQSQNTTTEPHIFRPYMQPQYKFPKMDFPRFDGKNVCGWISKAEKIFQLNPIMDSPTKVIYAVLYLDNEADYWYQTVQAEYLGLGWEAFTTLLLRRFSTGNQGNLIGKFNKLTQTSTVDAYVAEFAELRGYQINSYALYPEEFYLSSFLSGLWPDIQRALYIYKPSSLQDAIDKAKEHELFIDMIERRLKGHTKYPYSSVSYHRAGTDVSLPKIGGTTNQLTLLHSGILRTKSLSGLQEFTPQPHYKALWFVAYLQPKWLNAAKRAFATIVMTVCTRP